MQQVVFFCSLVCMCCVIAECGYLSKVWFQYKQTKHWHLEEKERFLLPSTSLFPYTKWKWWFESVLLCLQSATLILWPMTLMWRRTRPRLFTMQSLPSNWPSWHRGSASWTRSCTARYGPNITTARKFCRIWRAVSCRDGEEANFNKQCLATYILMVAVKDARPTAPEAGGPVRSKPALMLSFFKEEDGAWLLRLKAWYVEETNFIFCSELCR